MTSTDTLLRDLARRIVEAAGLAPSIHNTQPWRWRVGEYDLALFADTSRQLHIADPDGRQLLLSCGAALLHARLAVRAAGLVPDVTLFPSGGDDLDAGPLATIRITGGQPADPQDEALLAATHHRHTDRRPFDPRPLEPEHLRALRLAAEAEGAWLVSLDDTDLRIDTSVLIARADWLENHDPAYRTELESWSRATPDAEDGIPRDVVIGSDQPRQSEFAIRDFNVVGEPGLHLEQTGVERPGVLLIGTDADTAAERLRAGQAMERVLLTATARGIATSPLGQAVDLDVTRELLRHSVGGLGHIQMIIRVGYPLPDAEPLKATPRRSVNDILRFE
ncbi:Acg family FMN-binding oxidoreductase [Candidatus Protofrankia californiensis]|uniref:Acg family FMN-binding oxidoreductase n=1 Tax=Candidatus Protofrankia californiensis TaxID=1839754 RepID=UPI0010416831|nr:nitroreductase family protein [Candidatus Protofrankia californiensis]